MSGSVLLGMLKFLYQGLQVRVMWLCGCDSKDILYVHYWNVVEMAIILSPTNNVQKQTVGRDRVRRRQLVVDLPRRL